jgi:KipI family sensor histidine kinase inhibitor
MNLSPDSPLPSHSPDYRIEPFGEAAVIVLLGGGIDEASYQHLATLSKAIQENPPLGFTELVPAYNSLLVVFDPLVSDTAAISAAVQALAAALPPAAADAPKDTVELPVAYGGEYGPDLDSVASNAGLSTEEVIAIHSSRPYLVYMLGFTPGFPYLGGMDQRIAAPRLKTPRTKVPAGSVGIADTQTGVYPLESPGGWNLIGRTPLALFDPDRQDPALLAPGKYVRFVPISHDEFNVLHDSEVDHQENKEPEKDQLKSHRKPGTSPGMEPVAEDEGTPGRNITVLKPGALSTVQDSGRFGYQAAGVPPSGPMDSYSMSLANILAGNELEAACLECTLGGLELRFDTDSVFALAGADVPAILNDQAVPLHSTLRARAGDILRLGLARTGLRIYLAVAGGFAVPTVMGSRATFQRGGFGGFKGRALAAGDTLPLGLPLRLPQGLPMEVPLGKAPEATIPDRVVPQDLIPVFPEEICVRAIPSHEVDRFTDLGLSQFFSATYTVSQKSDRMGCRLEGPAIEHREGADIISSGVQTGTVQVPGDGQPIVLMADRQTTGGYTRIAQVIRADLPLLGQARPGDRVCFARCTPAEAAKALAVQYERLELVQTNILKSEPTSGRNTATQAARVKQFRVDIEGQSYIVTLEEVSS